MLKFYDIGDIVTVDATFRDEDGALASPATVEAHIKKPDGSVVELTPSEDSEGVFSAEVEPDTAGDWWYSFDGEGGLQASEERRFVVRQRQVPR